MHRRTFLKSAAITSALLPHPLIAAEEAQKAQDKPNIVFLLIDDMGWTGTSVQLDPKQSASKSDYYLTPNLERIAKEGARFSRAYAPAPMCTPTRGSILLGQTPATSHITFPGDANRQFKKQQYIPATNRNTLPEGASTIASVLKANGYRTAHIGKWHMGRGCTPGDFGFDVHDGNTDNLSASPDDPKKTNDLTKRSIQFITESKQNRKPFFLYLSYYAVHTPTEAKAETVAKFKVRPAGKRHTDPTLAAMTYELDQSVGKVLDALKQSELEKNTYVVILSDNGQTQRFSETENLPLRGAKSSLYEGGIRVPMFIRGPKVIANSSVTEPVIGYDLFPTFCRWAGVNTLPTALEGVDISALVSAGAKAKFKRSNPLYFHFPHYGGGPEASPQSALIDGKWKLLYRYGQDAPELYDLDTDISESKNLAESNPAKAQELSKALMSYLKTTKAQFPTKNPDYDASSAREEQREQRQKKRQGNQSGQGGGRRNRR